MNTEVAPPGVSSARPWLGIAAVLFGAFLSTLTTRLSTFGLADIRGAVHAGIDDGAWITTAETAGQMMVTPLVVWAGGIYGPRFVLICGASLFACASALLPLSGSLAQLLLLQFLAGFGSGAFIPLTLPVVLRSTSPQNWPFGVAIYALNLELSLNISASLEAWYIDHAGWQMIFWQDVPLALAMIGCLYVGLPRQPIPRRPPLPSIFGVTSTGVGLALIYAALDQGDRLDWLSSGLVVGMLLSGSLLVGAALLRLRWKPSSWFHLRDGLVWPLPLLLLLVLVLRVTILSTSYIIPQYLMLVRGYRSFEVGQALVWIAIPQLLTASIAAFMLRHFDSRWTAGLGLASVAFACALVATGLTPGWGPRQFLPTQLIQAFGQTLALSGIVFTSVLHMRKDIQLTLGGMIQTMRLMGGEIGIALTATLVRHREQRASNLIGQHVVAGSQGTLERLGLYGNILGSRSAPTQGTARAIAMLNAAIHRAADLQSCIDGFVAIAAIGLSSLILFQLVGGAPDGPANHRFARRHSRAA